MKIETLIREFDGLTTLQREERLKRFTGQHVEIANSVRDFVDGTIQLVNSYDVDGTILPVDRSVVGWYVNVSFDKAKWASQFLTYPAGTDVVLVAALKSGAFPGKYSNTLSFDLVSAVRLTTTVKSRAAAAASAAASAQMAAKAAEKAERLKSATWVGTLTSGVLCGVIGVVVGFVRSCNTDNGSIDGGKWLGTVLFCAGIGAVVAFAFVRLFGPED